MPGKRSRGLNLPGINLAELANVERRGTGLSSESQTTVSGLVTYAKEAVDR
jgi:hypothetical protein